MIVLPMAGLSRRFSEAGYTVPKFMLEVHGLSLFDQALLSFKSYFATENFLFVARDEGSTLNFIDSRCRALNVAQWSCSALPSPTRGQAETVDLGIAMQSVVSDTPLTIFNIDTCRPGFQFPVLASSADGFLEVFEGEGSNWSFARTAAPGSDRVVETAEKRPISRFCCTGLYHFARSSLFRAAYAAEAVLPKTDLQGGELYVAPLYNRLVAQGRDIRISVIDPSDVVFCGVPEEYEGLCQTKCTDW